MYVHSSVKLQMSPAETNALARLKQTPFGAVSSICDLSMDLDLEKYPEQAFGLWRVKGPVTTRHQIHCKICYMFPEIIKTWKGNNKNPNIMKQCGVQNRTHTVLNHIKSNYHHKCLTAYKRKQQQMGSKPNKSKEESPLPESELDKMISKGNAELAKTIANLAYSVYNDAVRLTLSAYSWPSRFVAQELGRHFDFCKSDETEERVKKINLQYIRPSMHSELLSCIVEADRDHIKTRIENAIAVSLRVDGSVDRTNLDKIYVLAKVVNRHGVLENIFIGVGEQTERFATGLHQAVIRTINRVHENLYETCVKKMSSFVTDGASVNTGEHKGLWVLIEKDLKTFYCGQEESMQVILKIWCAAHRSDLALKDITTDFDIFANAIKTLSSIASYFNTSSMRHEELLRIAKQNGFGLRRIPKHFEVRWSQFTFEIFESVLISWEALVTYFSSLKKADKSEKKYLHFLTDYYNVQLMAFITDLLYIFKRFQKRIQADNLNLVSLKRYFDNVIAAIEQLNDGPSIAGWESKLNVKTTIDVNNAGKIIYELRDIRLHVGKSQEIAARDCFDDLRREIVNTFIAFLTERFVIENSVMEFLEPFVAFDRDQTDLTKIQTYIAPDIDLQALNAQFNEMVNTPAVREMTINQLVSHLKQSDGLYDELLTVFARIMCATPHSADVERMISANNLLKTSMRNSLDIKTENKYLHVHYNMPALIDWDVRATVVYWLTKKERRQHNLNIENDKRKAKSQRYFNGIFDNKNRHIGEDIPTDDYDYLILCNAKRQRTTNSK